MTRVDSTGDGWQRLVREKMEVILGLREHWWQTLGGRGRYEGSLSWIAVVCNREDWHIVRLSSIWGVRGRY